jgi:hypothetical protein
MKGPMNLKHRKNIVREARKLIKLEIDGFEELPVGKRESIQDEYIERVCKSKGWDLAHFYCEEGNILDKILNIQ